MQGPWLYCGPVAARNVGAKGHAASPRRRRSPGRGSIRRRFWTRQEIGDARIVSIHGINELAPGIVRPGNGSFDRCCLLRREAGIIVGRVAKALIDRAG